VAGYHIIMKMQSYLTWITGLATIAYIALTIDDVKMDAVNGLPSGSSQQVVGALVLVMTGFGLGWINIAADWSRYQRRDASGASIVAWNTFGGALAPVVLVIYGLLLAGSDAKLRDGIQTDPIGTLATILPTWFLLPFAIVAVLGLVSGAVMDIYSSGLTLLTLGLPAPRWVAAAIDGVLMILGAIYIVWISGSDFIYVFEGFLITLGVPMAAWCGVFLADLLLRRRDYDEAAFYDARGRYGAVGWPAVLSMVVAAVVGWGLVVQPFGSKHLGWLGYLLDPVGLGGKTGTWAFANLGVPIALAVGFLGYLLLGARGVRRQERDQEPARATVA
jgi:purine-cytosine permease-like protein